MSPKKGVKRRRRTKKNEFGETGDNDTSAQSYMYTNCIYAQQGLEEGSGGDSLFPHHGFQNTTQATQQKMNMCTIIEFYCTHHFQNTTQASQQKMNMYYYHY
jgi:hypothetical protein